MLRLTEAPPASQLPPACARCQRHKRGSPPSLLLLLCLHAAVLQGCMIVTARLATRWMGCGPTALRPSPTRRLQASTSLLGRHQPPLMPLLQRRRRRLQRQRQRSQAWTGRRRVRVLAAG